MNKKEKLKEWVVFLEEFYKEDESLTEFNILHMYPKKIAYPDGLFDSRFFELVIFDEKNKKKRNVGQMDELLFDDKMELRKARIFIDGSTFMKFRTRKKLGWVGGSTEIHNA